MSCSLNVDSEEYCGKVYASIKEIQAQMNTYFGHNKRDWDFAIDFLKESLHSKADMIKYRNLSMALRNDANLEIEQGKVKK